MSVPFFLDTMVLLYAAMGREHEETKIKRARELVADGEFGTSTQVLQEFYHNARRKAHIALSPERRLAWLERLARLPMVETDLALVWSAAAICERYRISYRDGAMLAAAERLQAPVMYSEDLNHGQRYGSVRVINPFLPGP
jgi:predicted nucleic acid-binding protein